MNKNLIGLKVVYCSVLDLRDPSAQYEGEIVALYRDMCTVVGHGTRQPNVAFEDKRPTSAMGSYTWVCWPRNEE